MMPTPPDHESDTAYSPTMMDRHGPDGAMLLRARVITVLCFVISFPLITTAAGMRPETANHPLLTGLVGAALSACLVRLVLLLLPTAAGAVARAVTLPTGESTPYEEQYSFEESLAARGDVTGALQAFERAIAARPEVVAPRMRAAELYAARGADPARAAELFREIRGMERATGREALYACSRLVDLYDGALDDPGRALVELRRIIELYPRSPQATHARHALPRMKARLRDADG